MLISASKASRESRKQNDLFSDFSSDFFKCVYRSELHYQEERPQKSELHYQEERPQKNCCCFWCRSWCWWLFVPSGASLVVRNDHSVNKTYRLQRLAEKAERTDSPSTTDSQIRLQPQIRLGVSDFL
ncbi:unnamed protein product [Camellia sinensis]